MMFKRILLSFFLIVLIISNTYAQTNDAVDNNLLPKNFNNQSITKIISLSPEITELIYELDAQDLLKGVDINSNYPVEAQNLPKVADYFNIYNEKVIKIKPDLIIGTKSYNISIINHQKYLKDKTLLLDFSSKDNFKKSILTLGKVINKEERAQEIINTIDNETQKQQLKYQNSNVKPVVLIIWSKPISIIGRDSLINDLIKDCQSYNYFANKKINYFTINIEKLISIKDKVKFINLGVNPFNPNSIKVSNIDKELSDIMNRATLRTITIGLPKLCDIIQNK